MNWEGVVALRVSSAPPDATPVWVDITAYIHDGSRGQGWSITSGRQTPLSVSEPARLSLTLENADHRFTPGNPLSPYHPWWTQGARLQLQESVGSWSSAYPDFFLELPDVLVEEPGVDQIVTVSATDRLGRLQSAPAFISTLGAHILGSAPAANLVGYWTLMDSRSPFRPTAGSGEIAIRGVGRVSPYTLPSDLVAFDADGPPGEDVGGFPTFTPAYFDPPSPSAGVYAYPFGTANVAIHVGSGQTIALSAWMRPRTLIPALTPDLQDSFPFAVTESDTAPVSFGTDYIAFEDFLSTTGAAVFAGGGSSVLVSSGAVFPREVWRLVTASITIPSGDCTLWVGPDVVASGTLSGAPSSYDFAFLHVGQLYFGALAHLQVYVGTGSPFTHADHLAQMQVGLTGLERQHTGERVRTICAYAGVPAGEIDADAGVAVMGRASLAGKDPLTALREAETTEQGRLFCVGNTVAFRHRHLRYDDRHTD